MSTNISPRLTLLSMIFLSIILVFFRRHAVLLHVTYYNVLDPVCSDTTVQYKQLILQSLSSFSNQESKNDIKHSVFPAQIIYLWGFWKWGIFIAKSGGVTTRWGPDQQEDNCAHSCFFLKLGLQWRTEAIMNLQEWLLFLEVIHEEGPPHTTCFICSPAHTLKEVGNEYRPIRWPGQTASLRKLALAQGSHLLRTHTWLL